MPNNNNNGVGRSDNIRDGAGSASFGGASSNNTPSPAAAMEPPAGLPTPAMAFERRLAEVRVTYLLLLMCMYCFWQTTLYSQLTKQNVQSIEPNCPCRSIRWQATHGIIFQLFGRRRFCTNWKVRVVLFYRVHLCV